MRYEWRKQLENGYERDMQDVKQRVQQEKKEVRSGPTTIGVLGSYYERQLAKQRMAQHRQDMRADRYSEATKAPTMKDSASEAMEKAEQSPRKDERGVMTDRMRARLARESASYNQVKSM